MHSRIFIISTNKEDITDIDLNEIHEDYRPQGADWVCDSDINKDIKNFEKWFNVKAEEITEKAKTIYKVKTEDFLKSVKEHEKNNIEEIKRLILEPKPDLYQISNLANPKNETFFIVDNDGLVNEFDTDFYFIDDKNPDKHIDFFYITKSFDYHY